MSQTVEISEVLTLEGAAAFLRVSEDAVLRLVVQQMLPGRQIDGQWRFLRAALADDESLSDLRAAIYAQRGRPEVEEG